jgi:diacylglycerol kinase family enzyme
MRRLGEIAGDLAIFEITNTFDDLSRAVRRFREANISLLAINGGDGTVARTLTALLKEYGSNPLPRVVLLRGGTINVLACNLGIFGSPESILRRLVRKVRDKRPLASRSITMLQVNNELGFLFGNGFTATFLDEFYKNKTGHLGSLWLILKIAFSFLVRGELFRRVVVPLKVRLSAEGQPAREVESVAVLCATIPRMPMGPKLFPAVETRLNAFQLWCYTLQPHELVWHLHRAVLQKDKPHARFGFLGQQASLSIEGSDLYTLDGELHRADNGRIEIATGPTLEFLTLKNL